MKKEELIDELLRLNVPESTYSLDGRIIEGVNLEKTTNHYGNNKAYNEWRVFLNDQGERFDEEIFYNEEEAYSEILKRLKKFS